MKNIITLLTLILLSSQSYAQSGSVYFFNFNVEPELTEYLKIETSSRSWLNGMSESEIMPDSLLTEIKERADSAFTSILDIPVTMCYRTNKKGEEVGSVGVFGTLEGFPDNTFKKGVENCPTSTHFIYIDVKIYSSGGSSVKMVKKHSKLKPKLVITAKVLDADKNKVWNKKVVLKDFETLRAVTEYYQSIEATHSETLSPFDIYAMYLMGMDELIKE